MVNSLLRGLAIKMMAIFAFIEMQVYSGTLTPERSDSVVENVENFSPVADRKRVKFSIQESFEDKVLMSRLHEATIENGV